MTFSNTATPYYYGRFREQVLSGERPVNKEIAMEMNRIDALIANPGVWYDSEAINGFIEYVEKELTLTDGSEVHMLEEFKLWAEQIFGWWYYVERSVYVPSGDPKNPGHYERRLIKKRLTTKQMLIVARGAAKSMYASFLQSYFLNVDTSTTDQIVTAPTMRQAEETLSPMRTSIARSRGPLFRFLTQGSIQNTTGNKMLRQKLVSTKKGIENFLTGSIVEVRPMSVDKLQGLRCKLATVDEWLSGDVREDPFNAIEQGASKVDDYLIVGCSSEGTVRNGIGDSIKMELMSILRGEYNDPHVSIWYYRLDDIKEVNEPRMWIKAQPNIGITVSYETYQQDVEKAEQNPAARNDILAKRFGIPMEGYTYFFTYQETLCHPPRDFWNMTCAMGVDLSLGDDFCAFTFIFPLNGADSEDFGVKTIAYITEDTLVMQPIAVQEKYREFMDEGSLVVMPGTTLKLDTEVYDDLDAYIERNQYEVLTVGYDPYNAKAFMDRWETENGSYGVEVVRQGVRTESVPLGELKKLAEHRRLIFDQSIMQFTMGNCIVLIDNNNQKKLYKKRPDQKIDNVAALMDAYVAFKENREAFE